LSIQLTISNARDVFSRVDLQPVHSPYYHHRLLCCEEALAHPMSWNDTERLLLPKQAQLVVKVKAGWIQRQEDQATQPSRRQRLPEMIGLPTAKAKLLHHLTTFRTQARPIVSLGLWTVKVISLMLLDHLALLNHRALLRDSRATCFRGLVNGGSDSPAWAHQH
jgi:hypothetical protein